MGRKSPFPRNQEWNSANAKTLRSWFLLVGRGERGRSSVNKFAGKRSDHALHRKAMSPIGTDQAFVYLSRKVSWVELISSHHVVHHCSFDISNWFNEGEVSSFTVCGPFDGCHRQHNLKVIDSALSEWRTQLWSAILNEPFWFSQ